MPAPILIGAAIMAIWFLIDNVPFYYYTWLRSQGKAPGDRSFKAQQMISGLKTRSFNIKTAIEQRQYSEAENGLTEMETLARQLKDYIDAEAEGLKTEGSYGIAVDAYNSYTGVIKLLREKIKEIRAYLATRKSKAEYREEYSNAKTDLATQYKDQREDVIDWKGDKLADLKEWYDAEKMNISVRRARKEITIADAAAQRRELTNMYRTSRDEIKDAYRERRNELIADNRIAKAQLKVNYVENLSEAVEAAPPVAAPTAEIIPPPEIAPAPPAVISPAPAPPTPPPFSLNWSVDTRRKKVWEYFIFNLSWSGGKAPYRLRGYLDGGRQFDIDLGNVSSVTHKWNFGNARTWNIALGIADADGNEQRMGDITLETY